MEVLLRNGDIAVDRQGLPLPVEGVQAVLQRAVLRLSVRQGSHPADPRFGSRLHRIRGPLSGQRLNARVQAAVREALAPMGELEIARCQAAYDSSRDQLRVALTLRCLEQEYPLEVAV